MSRRFMTALSLVVVLSMSIWGQVFASSGQSHRHGLDRPHPPRSPRPEPPSCPRPAAAGPSRGRGRDAAYSIGFEDGRFYANGWHITGEMAACGRRR